MATDDDAPSGGSVATGKVDVSVREPIGGVAVTVDDIPCAIQVERLGLQFAMRSPTAVRMANQDVLPSGTAVFPGGGTFDGLTCPVQRCVLSPIWVPSRQRA